MTEHGSAPSESRGSQSRSSGRRRFSRRPRNCKFCGDKSLKINYKEYELLKRFVNEAGKIRSRRETGNCAKHQRLVSKEVKRARHMALLPFVTARTR
ncbi:MAG: 30S ribosomal protein S18 [Anaerolineales bacterium]